MRKTALTMVLALAGVMVMGGIRPAVAASPTGSVPFALPAALSGHAVARTALMYVGYPYHMNGADPATGFDSVGFVRYVFALHGVQLPTSLSAMVHDGKPVKAAHLKAGDLVFFTNTVSPGLSHVGIYLGKGQFVHAEWFGLGVRVSSLSNDPHDSNYWSFHYLSAVRIRS